VLYDGSFLEGIEVQWNPIDYCFPVEAVSCANTWQVIYPIHPIIDSKLPFLPKTFSELIHTLDPWVQEMLQHLTLHVPPFQLIQALLEWVANAKANDT
jgi:hypothetical protein